MTNGRRPLVAGNWKMNGISASLGEIAAIGNAVAAGGAGGAEIVLCPPATLLMAAAKLCDGASIGLGGQDCHEAPGGAHTGDIAAEMLRDAGASYVIVGHSERRADHGETNSRVRAKAAAGFRAGLSIILCVGETHAERMAGEALSKVSAQLAGSLPQDAPAARLVIAYEPVWAIGTGLTPTLEDVAAMHGFLREQLELHLPGGAAVVRILYGGSVKPANAAELLGVADVDGALVGGASLTAAEFVPIAGVYRSSKT